MAIILDGKKLRDKLLADLKIRVERLERKPTLAVVLVGDDPASQIYVNNKKKAAENVGIKSIIINMPSTTGETELVHKIQALNNDNNVTAILVQLPLPKHINKNNIINSISPQKDADGFTTANFGLLFSGQKPYVYPCTPKGILLLLDEYNINLEGKHVVIIGRSNIVGRPLSQMMLDRNATVTICHSRTQNLTNITKTADVLISAVGEKIIEENMLNNNAMVMKLQYKSFSMLFTGDIEEIAEKKILNLYKGNADKLNTTVLKVAHHGSKSSSTEEFLKVVNSKVAIIGVGENNMFGHPNNEVLERLQSFRHTNF